MSHLSRWPSLYRTSCSTIIQPSGDKIPAYGLFLRFDRIGRN
jgi:hypothetical protein